MSAIMYLNDLSVLKKTCTLAFFSMQTKLPYTHLTHMTLQTTNDGLKRRRNRGDWGQLPLNIGAVGVVPLCNAVSPNREVVTLYFCFVFIGKMLKDEKCPKTGENIFVDTLSFPLSGTIPANVRCLPGLKIEHASLDTIKQHGVDSALIYHSKKTIQLCFTKKHDKRNFFISFER